jgi:hypothetical protein
MPRLIDLPAGTRFRQPDLNIEGTLLMVNECRARVRLDYGIREVDFTDPYGQRRAFTARRINDTCWASTVLVEALSFSPLEEGDVTMARRRNTPTETPTVAPRRGRGKQTATLAPTGPVSQIKAAAMVLAANEGPMTCQAMVSAMAEQGLWQSPGGKTPHATLYAAILREITTKGEQARFRKVDRGQFEHTGVEA